MCGISGIYGASRPHRRPPAPAGHGRRAVHRGPDGVGLYLDGRFGMANTRLAIVDLEGGDQPLSDERGRYWVMQNGEIYNYVELRAELEQLGHRFATTSDTEVIAHAYAEWGVGCLDRLNGDFAIAIWDRADRRGCSSRATASACARSSSPSTTATSASPPRRRRCCATPRRVASSTRSGSRTRSSPGRRCRTASAFAGIRELPPAHYVVIGPDGAGPATRWWDIDFSPRRGRRGRAGRRGRGAARPTRSGSGCARTSQVGAYLSGGLDSSAIAAIAARQVGEGRLSRVRARVRGRALRRERGAGCDRRASWASSSTGPSSTRPRSRTAFPRAVELAEKPMLRTAPAPLLRLAGAVRDAGLKVVLTGEARGRALRRLRHLPRGQGAPLLGARPVVAAAAAALPPAEPLARDRPRAGRRVPDALLRARTCSPSTTRSTATGSGSRTPRRCLRMLEPGAAAARPRPTGSSRTACAPRFRPASSASRRSRRAQYLEIATFFEGYLLHTQGDRMLMAHSIEGRFPFVDYRLAELAARLPGLAAAARPAGEVRAAEGGRAASFPSDPVAAEDPVPRADPRRLLRARRATASLLEPEAVRDAGLLDETAVARLVAKFANGRPGQRDRRDGARRLDVADDPPRPARREPAARARARAVPRSSSATRSCPPVDPVAEAVLTQRLVQDSLLASAAAAPDKVAIVDEYAQRTYAELRDDALRFARRSAGRAGSSAATASRSTSTTRCECAVAIFGVLLAGGVFTFINPQTKADKLAFILDDSEARFLVTEAHSAGDRRGSGRRGAERRADVHDHARGAGARSADIREAIAGAAPEPAARHGSRSISPRSSTRPGTTGEPKGVMHSHAGARSSRREHRATTCGSRRDDRILSVLPIAFTYGLSQLLAHRAASARRSCSSARSPSRRRRSRACARRRPRSSRPSRRSSPRFSPCPKTPTYPSVRCLTNAAAGLPPALHEGLRARLPERVALPHVRPDGVHPRLLPGAGTDRRASRRRSARRSRAPRPSCSTTAAVPSSRARRACSTCAARTSCWATGARPS